MLFRSDDLWEWLALDDDDKVLLEAYQDAVDEKGDISDARDAFHGIHDSKEDFAASWYDETGELDQIPEGLRCHIDWEGVARDFSYSGWVFHRVEDGVYVFAPN